tara:strand:+ start:1308 stop:3554 length:2247 start_codon:yes stop_codon:yes gene_type:complete
MKQNINKTDNVKTTEAASWIKLKIIQIFGFILIIFSFYLFFSLYYFNFDDYGNPYIFSEKQDILWIYYIGAWFNGITAYWSGNFSWALPLAPLVIGYNFTNKTLINNYIIKLILFLISIIIICTSMKNLNFNGGQISLLFYKFFIELSLNINIKNNILAVNSGLLCIGIILYLYSIGVRFKIYSNIMIIIFKTFKTILIKFYYIIYNSFNYSFLKNTDRKHKIKKSISKRQTPNLGIRGEKEKQNELDLLSNENNIFKLPHLDLLEEPKIRKEFKNNDEHLDNTARMLENVLDDFGIRGEIGRIQSGPVVTRYELEPAPGVRSSRVIGLSDDIARSMSAISTRVAVVPGRNAIGIELPNEDRETFYLREIISSKAFEKNYELPLALGRDIAGNPIITDLSKMPHLLVAGTTGSGKSVAVNAMILSMLYTLEPKRLKFIMIDPKMLELSVYEDIPHLLHPVVTESRKAIVALKWAVKEMNNRYRLMSQLGVRSIYSYNNKIVKSIEKGQVLTKTFQTGFDPDTGQPKTEKHELESEILPNIVIVIDEMADLMITAGREIEISIQALAQKARAAGIHLIVATQRPSVDVITGTIKANLPTRISFQVTSKIDSRTILGEQGAEQLLGKGDMLFMESASQVQRIHGPFVTDNEVEKVASYLRKLGTPNYIFEITSEESDQEYNNDEKTSDPLFEQAIELIAREQKASTSFLQRHLQIGYNRAARIIDVMEAENMISPASQTGKREVLINQKD